MKSIRITLGLVWCVALAPGLGVAQQPANTNTPTDASTSYVGPAKIVKLLWKANPASAAKTLGKSIATAAERGELSELRESLGVLRSELDSVVSSTDRDDPRYAPALAAKLLDEQNRPPVAAVSASLTRLTSLEERQMLWQVWLAVAPRPALEYFQARLAGGAAEPLAANSVAAAAKSGETSAAVADEAWLQAMIAIALRSDRKRTADILISNWDRLTPATQLAAIEPLTATADTMQLLLTGVAQGSIPKDLINTNQLRKWSGSSNAALAASIETLWGRVRAEDNAARAALVAETWQSIQRGAQGSVARGAAIFDRVCSQCHVLHGRGYEVGPDIAGNGRGNLQQLISNILDPSLVIGEAFQAKTVLTLDGEVVSGLVAAENDRYLTLKVQGGKTIEFEKAELEEIQTSKQSLMPEGVETQMQPQELFDLLAYLCLLKPLDADDNELIPGTPSTFVQP